MHGFICDRCHAVNPGQKGGQRDPGPFPPSGWAKIPIPQNPDYMHLCSVCSADFAAWVREGRPGG